MAITAIEYSLFRSLRRADKLPQGGDILELGEANWYGDVGMQDLGQDIYRYAPEDHRLKLFRDLDKVSQASPADFFAIAKVFWHTFFAPRTMTAIDLHGGKDALKLNLNEPIDLGRSFDVVMNLGTIEHVFDVAQALTTMHNHTRPGGMMVHGMPLSGWVDHGFYSFNSTFYWDLARANDYHVVACIYAQLEPLKLVPLKDRNAILDLAGEKKIGDNSLIYMIFRRPDVARAFKAPLQGYYAGELSAEAAQRWRTER
jgi:SAM-dependent methyltransferase